MNYLHDVHVNWVDGGSRKHEIPEYFEWKEGDPLDFYDTIPLLFVEKELFNILEDGYVEIPKDLLSMIHRTAVRINPDTRRKNKVDYCFAICDGEGVLVINTEGDTRPNLKSRLTTRMEVLILDMAADHKASDKKPYHFEIKPDELELDEGEDTSIEGLLLSTNPNDYIGLTRVEKEMKQIVLDCLFNLNCSDNRAEIVYWYIEMFPHMFGKTNGLDREIMINELFLFLRLGWGKRHEEWGTNMVKAVPNDIYKDEWAKLLKDNKKDKVTN